MLHGFHFPVVEEPCGHIHLIDVIRVETENRDTGVGEKFAFTDFIGNHRALRFGFNFDRSRKEFIAPVFNDGR